MRPLVNCINRRPVDARTTEGRYTLHAVCDPENVPDVRDLLFETLEAAHYPVREVEVLTEGDDIVELGAILVASSAGARELDQAVQILERTPVIKSTTWSVSATP